MRNTFIMTALHAALTKDAGEGSNPIGVNLGELATQVDEPESDEVKQARKARLDRAREQAVKDAKDSAAMPAELLGLAQQEIRICWDEFAGKDGVWENLKQVKRKMSNISAHILAIAKACAAEASKMSEDKPGSDPVELAGRLFRNAMAAAEQGLRGSLNLLDDEAEAKLDEFLKSSWNVYKSQAKTGFDAGLDPRGYDSLYGITKAVKAVKDARSTGTRTDEAPQTGTDANTDTSADAGSGDDEEIADDEETAEHLSADELGEIIARDSAKVRAALVLFHKAIDDTDLNDEELETRVCNIISLAVRELNKLPRMTHDDEEETHAEALKAKEA